MNSECKKGRFENIVVKLGFDIVSCRSLQIETRLYRKLVKW